MSASRWIHDRVLGRSSSGGTALRHLDTGAELQFSGGRLLRGRRYHSCPPVARRELARTGAILRLRERNRFFVHASAVVDPLGRCVLLVGDSGAGKSTIAYALYRSGWRLLGDDGVVLEPHGDSVIAHCWRRPAMVSVTLASHFPELAGRERDVPAGDSRRRACIAVEHARSAPVSVLVILERGAPGSLTELPTDLALSALLSQSPWVLLGDHASRAHFHALVRTVELASTWKLVHGPAELAGVHRRMEGVLS